MSQELTKELSKKPTKTTWCRDARAHMIIKIAGFIPFRQSRGFVLRTCTYGDACRGAHTQSEIMLQSDIFKWNNCDKSIVNFPLIQDEMIQAINRDKVRMRDGHPFREEISRIGEMNFIELSQLWRSIVKYFGKIAKESQKKKEWRSSVLPPSHSTGYTFAEDVPRFYLTDNVLDTQAWNFTRTLLYCDLHKQFVQKITNKTLMTIRDFCVGDKNCKDGVHRCEEHLCFDDFMTGRCDCTPKIEFDKIIFELQSGIQNIKKSLSVEHNQKNIERLTKMLKQTEDVFYNTQRKLHFTEGGMKPFIQQNEEYIKYKEELNITMAAEEAKRESVWKSTNQEPEKIKKVVKISFKK